MSRGEESCQRNAREMDISKKNPVGKWYRGDVYEINKGIAPRKAKYKSTTHEKG